MKKKTLKIVGVMLFTFVVSLGVNYGLRQGESKFDLLLDQVEASASNSEGWTKTTWNCVGKVSKCYQMCPNCGTVVNSRGDLTGMHSCGN